ncbi:class I SAM-dependent methyltransferase [Acidobacteria bacterium AB60]|nr:class I SAM-dependent methyltransferase [Acidobacteria bacterium AB60]
MSGASILAGAPNFDRLAGVYRWMEWLSFGGWLWRCRCGFLPEMRAARRALVLGDGDGRFTARLLRENPGVEVDAVDISPAMLEALRSRAGDDRDRLRTHVADVRLGPPAGEGYDLVVTHFLLDCLTTAEVEELALRVRSQVTPDAVWVVSEFAEPAGWFGRLVARPLVRLLYGAFGWMTGLRVRKLPDWEGALARAGFRRRERKTWLRGLLVGVVWG